MTGMRFEVFRIATMVAPLLLAAIPASAQNTPATVQTGGQQGRIRTTTGVQSTQRINSRIQYRVQLRVRNRIDSSYAPQANAASPFEAAEDKITQRGPPRTRSGDPN